MTITELHERIAIGAAKELAAELRTSAQGLRLLTFRQAAELLGVSEPTARRLIKEYVELGEASKRVSLATLEKLISARTVKIP